MKKIDLKSFLIGILTIILVTVILGSKIQGNNQVGKYQVAAASTKKSPKYIIIDTADGSIVETGFILED